MSADELTAPGAPIPRGFLFSEPVALTGELRADIAFLGVPYGQAYSFREMVNDQSNGPAAMRRASDRMIRSIERYDFDLGGPLYDGRPIRAVDCGDVRADSARCDRARRAHRGGGAGDPASRGHAHRARRRSRDPDPGVARVRRTRADHAGADRSAHRLARGGERRARRIVEPDPPRIGDGACRRDLPDRPARDRQRAAGRGGCRDWPTART